MYDVIIIGGGPAGSTAASYLAMDGHKVLLLEKEKFPRDHVGESLLPFCYKLFDELGVLPQMKAGFVRKPGVRFIDKDGVASTTWCFDHVIHDESYLSFQVVRKEFDNILLKNARRLGASAVEETRVISVDFDTPDGGVVVNALDSEGQKHTYSGRFLLDCSGRSAFVSSSKGMRKKYDDLDRTALWTHYHNVDLSGGLEDGLSLIIYIGGEKKGWTWVFPLDSGHVTVGVVLNNNYIRSQRAKFDEADVDDWKQALYEQELGYSEFVKQLLVGAKMAQPLTVEGDYSYYSEQKFGQNFALVGDAASFIDPIFSSGIYLAMNSARLVAKALNKQLHSPTETSGPLTAAYEHINGAYKMVHKLIQFFYTTNVINFAQMEEASDIVYQSHEDAMATGHFLLAGDFFDRYEYYSQVIDSLQKPRLYELYKETVIERPSFQVTVCSIPDETIFPKQSETMPLMQNQ